MNNRVKNMEKMWVSLPDNPSPSSVFLSSEYFKTINYPNHVRLSDGGISYIYLFRNEFSGLSKIGITNHPLKRFRTLMNSCGQKLQYLFFFAMSAWV